MIFYDWLKITQVFPSVVPVVADQVYHRIDTATGEHIATTQQPIKQEGSYSTSIQVRISGNQITMTGNPSRYDRLDNLIGYSTLRQCVAVYNKILRQMGLSDYQFTPGTKLEYRQSAPGTRPLKVSDGATIQEIHITSNKTVGEGNEDSYIRGLSTLKYRNSEPHLFSNGKTVDWKSKKGNASLVYPSVYNKAHEIRLKHLEKSARSFGKESPEYKYLLAVVDYCETHGVVRFEQKLKSQYLRRYGFNHYGLFDETELHKLHEEFLNLDSKLQVEAMTIEGISDKLLRLEICGTQRAANTTALYAIQWMNGQRFDLSKTQVQTHRARLRKIGIDICSACDVSRHSPVFVRKIQRIEVSDMETPHWYQHASINRKPNLSLVA